MRAWADGKDQVVFGGAARVGGGLTHPSTLVDLAVGCTTWGSWKSGHRSSMNGSIARITETTRDDAG